jgi:HEAT repeat protein
MRKDFPKKAARLLARAFGYVPMIGALASPDAGVSAGAVLVLQTGGTPALELLLQAVDSADFGVRINAVRALKGHMGAGSIAALVKCLAREGDAEKEFRSAAAESLSAQGVLAVPALAEASKDAKSVVREGAAEALGGIRTAPSLALLTPLFDDPDSAVRGAAIAAAGRHRSRAAVLTLIERLGTAKLQERDSYLTAIDGSVAPLGTDDEEIRGVPALDWDRDLAARFLAKMPLLVDDAGLREKAAGLVEKIGDPAAGPTIQMLRSESAAMRAWAAGVLGKRGGDAVLPSLIQAAGDSDAGVRVQVAKALGSYGDHIEIIEPLGRLMLDASPEICSEAVLSLGRAGISDEAKPYLQRLIATPDRIKILVDMLSSEYADKSALKDDAAVILGMLGKAVIEPVAGIIKAGSLSTRTAAVHVLGNVGGPAAAAALIDLTKDPIVQTDNGTIAEVYRALGQAKGGQALDVLLAGLKRPEEGLRSAAVDGLKELGDIRAADALAALLPIENAELLNKVDTAMRVLTKYEPEDGQFDWKAWWAKNRGRYGLK